MFEAAKDIVRAQGLTISLEEIAMDDIISRASVSRSSAYRLWPYKGDFVDDLLMNFAGPDWMVTCFDPATAVVAVGVVVEHWDLLATAQGRRAVALETVRQTVGTHVDTVATAIDWEVYVTLLATARGMSNDELRQQLSGEVERAEVAFVDAMARFCAVLCEAVGLQLRHDSYSFRHLAIAVVSAIEGMALRKALAESNIANEHRRESAWSLHELVSKHHPGPAIDGGTADWSVAAWMVLGILDSATEPVANWKPTEEMRSAVQDLRGHLRRDRAAHAPDEPESW